jgi:benzoate membrane transport protein
MAPSARPWRAAWPNPERDAGLFTFLVTASGVTFLGLSAAFWGLLFGLLAHALVRLRRPRAQEVLSHP